jgi:fumarate hydratase class II
LLTDYQSHVQTKIASKSYATLVSKLRSNSEQLALMKDVDVVELFQTDKNIKNLLTHSLALITAIAGIEGYTLNELML